MAREHAARPPKARPAPGAPDDRARGREGKERPVRHRILELPPRGGHHLEPHVRCDPLAAEHRGGLAKIDEPAVRARAQEHHVDGLADRLRHVDDLVDAGRDGDLRFQSGEVDPDLVRVRRVRVGKEPVGRLGRTDDDPRLRAHLGGHSGKGDAVALRKIPGTVELHTGVARTVGPDLANDPHDRVLHRHAFARPTAERDLDRLRYPQPRPPKG